MQISRQLLAVLAAAGVASAASAASTDFGFFNISNNGNTNVASQLKLTVSDVSGQPNQVDFTFHNLVGVASSIEEIYIDANAVGSVFASGMIQSQTGATFTWGSASPGDLPGGKSISPAFVTTTGLLADANGGPTNGLDSASDVLTVRLTTNGGKTYSDIVNGLSANPTSPNSIRVGLHVISIGNTGGSDSFTTTVVPLPAAAYAGLTCLACVIGAGWRRARANSRPA